MSGAQERISRSGSKVKGCSVFAREREGLSAVVCCSLIVDMVEVDS